MVPNAAKDLVNQTTPQQQSESQIGITVQPTVKAVSWRQEVRLCAVCGAVLLGLMGSVVTMKIAVTNANHQLQDVQARVTTVSNDNASERQEIAELTSESHLNQAAKKYGLSDANTSVRNVNK